MPEIETVQVIWPAKFGDKLVRIDATDFDATIHQLPASGGPVTKPDRSRRQPATERPKQPTSAGG